MQNTRREFLIATAAAGTATAAARLPAVTPAANGWHVAMIGDSIFDNARYVPGKPSVIEQLGKQLGDRGKASLLARDGDVTNDVTSQLDELPDDATHLVVSVGGNDALQHAGLLNKVITNSAELLAELATIQRDFQRDYAKMLDTVLGREKPTALCTVYDSNYDQPKKRLADVALTVFNDVILRCAFDARVPVIDLRQIFTERTHYANAIEPSELGGAKMVDVIVQVVAEHDFSKRRTTLYG